MGDPFDGLGLEHGRLSLVRSSPSWIEAGADLASDVGRLLGCPVEHVGSTAVVGLLAKPIIDLAAGLPPDADLDGVRVELEGAGWTFRGDAGDSGGLVFVLERTPGIRVAHLHGVDLGGDQWERYLQFRDRLRTDPEARARYEEVKRALLAELGSDNSRRAYTDGKTEVVRSLDGTGPG